MKHISPLLITLFALCLGVANAWADTATKSWDLNSESSDWSKTNCATYFSKPYGMKQKGAAITNGNISDFSITGITKIEIGVTSLQNGVTTSILTVALLDKDGKALTSQTITPANASAASKTTRKAVSFSASLAGVQGYSITCTTFGKNILITGTDYIVTYESTPITTYSVNLNQPKHGEGTISADKTKAAEGDKVTLTAMPNAGYYLTGWTVLDGDAEEISVTDNQFTMPASNVEVEGIFASCTQLPAPTELSASVTAYNAATLSWNKIENATKYQITTTPPAFGGSATYTTTGTETTYTATDLTPETKYTWKVKALGNGTTYCDSKESADGTFTTSAKPKYTITWSSPTNTIDPTSVTQGDKIGTLPPAPAVPQGCPDKVFMGWSENNIGTTGTDVAPAFITAETVPTANTTYYAVFATQEGSGVAGWTLVTSESDLIAGQIYTIASSETPNSGKVLGKKSTNNYDEADWTSVSTIPTQLTLGGSANAWTLNDGTGYLYAASSSKNYLQTQSTNDQNGQWSITFSQTAVIKARGTNTHNTIKYNSNSKIFSCYTGGQQAVYLFKYSAGSTYTDYVTNCVECTAPTTPLALSIADATLNLGEDGTAKTTFSTIGGNGAEIVYSLTPEVVSALSDDVLTFTQAGTYTLTAQQDLNTADGTTYCGSRVSQTITVTKNPVLYFTTTPSNPIEFPEVECGGNTPLSQKQQISLQGYNLTGDVAVAVTGDYKIARTASAALSDYTTEFTLPKTIAGKINATYSSVYVLSCPPAQSNSATNGTLTITTDKGNTLTVNLSTPTVTCDEYTLTLNDRGSKKEFGSYYAGAMVSQPADPTGVCTEPINYVFDGWATAEVANGSTTYTPVSFPYTMPKNNTTLYAVYRYTEIESNDFQIADADVDLEDGKDCILTAQSSNAEYALSSVTSTDVAGRMTTKEVAVDEDEAVAYKIQNVTDNTIIWTLEGNASDGYSFLNKSTGTYLTAVNGTLSMEASATTKYTISHPASDDWRVEVQRKGSVNYLSGYKAGEVLFSDYSKSTLKLYLYGRAYSYTTSPVCGPYIKATGDVAITSGKGIWVESVTPLTISAKNLDKNDDNAAVTITATVTDEAADKGFSIKTPGTQGAGSAKTPVELAKNYTDATYDGALTVVYTPTEDDVTAEGKIALRVYKSGGSATYATDTIVVRGRSLPTEFVLAAKTANGWVALPSDLGANYEETLKTPYKIEVDDKTDPTIATEAPTTAVYHSAMRSTANTCASGIRFEANGTYLEGGTAANNDNVWLSTTNSKEYQSWVLTSTDFVDYSVRMEASPEDKCLHYNTNRNINKIGNYAGKGTLRFLPIENKCTRFDAPILDKHKLTSTSVTLRLLAIENAMGYEYSTDESNWKKIENVTIEDNYVVATIDNLAPNTEHTLYVRVKTDGENCSEVASIKFNTPLCDDVPSDIHYLSTINSITLMWNSEAKTSMVVLYSDAKGTNELKRIENAKSPATIDGLERATTYYALILAGGTCGGDTIEVSTERPQMSVVEWAPDAIDVSINTDEKVSVVLENEITKGTGHSATDLFFSKYFEASGSVKLLAIYNGTGKTISLENVRIEGMSVTSTTATDWNADDYDIIELSPLKEIKSDEEIVLYSLFTHHTVDYENAVDEKGQSTEYDKNRSISIAKCINSSIGWNQNGWYPVGDNTINVLKDAGVVGMTNLFGDAEIATGGSKTYRLIRRDAEGNDTDIDVLGVLTADKQVIKTSDLENCRTTGSSKNPNRKFDGDGDGWTCTTGREYDSDNDRDYVLSTNRHLLIRKNTVTSGLHAVESNTDGFNTLCEEWEGRIVEKGTDENATTCEEFSNVSGFQYNEYYTTYETLVDNTEFDESKRNPDGTYTINVLGLNKLACCKLKIIAKDKDGIELLTKEYRVPIMVTNSTDTRDGLFHFEGDTCKNCDVVVRDKAKLTHSNGGVDEFRNMYVYAGSQLKIPDNETFTLNAVQMFARNDSVSYAIINNAEGATITVKEVSHIKRIDGKYWYPFSLPYDCKIADIRDQSGESLGVYGTDWGIKFYDGERRQRDGNSTTHYGEVSKYWTMMPENGVLKAYTGYIIGLFYPDENLMRSVNFPPANISAYTEDATSKTTPITNWPDNLDAQPRHHGWNFVGSPYISLFGAATGEGLYNDQLKMGWTDAYGEQQDKEHIYVSIPDGGNSNTYTQALASGVTIKPFTAYFVQAIDPTNNQSNTLSLTYSKANRHLLASPARAAADASPLILAELDIRCGALHDNTGVLVSDDYSVDYEIGDDLYKMYAAAAKPQLYTTDASSEKMAYQALPDVLAHAVPLGIYLPAAGDYTLSLNRYVSRLEAAEAVYLLHDGKVVADLLQTDYTLTAAARGSLGGYTLDIRRAPKMPTDILPAAGDAPYLMARDGVLTVANLPAGAMVQVYDVLGRVLLRTTATEQSLSVPAAQTGVYTVLITTDNLQTVLKTLLR